MRIACFVLMTCSVLPRLGHAQTSPDAVLSARAAAISEARGRPISQPTAGKSEPLAPAQRFVCSTGFTLEECKQSMSSLMKLLEKYRAASLGEWKWVLVRSEDWKYLLLAHGIRQGVPAITALEIKTTFFDEALVTGPAGRVYELMGEWHLGRDALLDLAVRHELGHALCSDIGERNAERVAKLLEQNKPISCDSKGEAGRASAIEKKGSGSILLHIRKPS